MDAHHRDSPHRVDSRDVFGLAERAEAAGQETLYTVLFMLAVAMEGDRKSGQDSYMDECLKAVGVVVRPLLEDIQGGDPEDN